MKIGWIQSHHFHLQSKLKLLAGKFTWGNKAKHCLVMSTIFLLSKVCWQCSAMFCLYHSSKLSRPYFEFSMKVRRMELNWSYLIKSSLLYAEVKCDASGNQKLCQSLRIIYLLPLTRFMIWFLMLIIFNTMNS